MEFSILIFHFMWFTFQSKQHFLHNFSICYQISCHQCDIFRELGIFWSVIFHLGSKSLHLGQSNINNITLIHLNNIVDITRGACMWTRLKIEFAFRFLARENSVKFQCKGVNLCFVHIFWVKSFELHKYANVIKHAYHYHRQHDKVSVRQDAPKVIYISMISLTGLCLSCPFHIFLELAEYLGNSKHGPSDIELKLKKIEEFIYGNANGHEKFKSKS